MDIKIEVREMEVRIKAAGMNIGEFCELAEVNPSTWHRWKIGAVSPLMETWERVQGALPKEVTS